MSAGRRLPATPTRDLDDPDEIAEMVRRFYQDVAQDELLGPMFEEVAQVDWSAHTAFPVYGMPHPVRDTTLVLAAEDNDFWRSFVPDTAQLPGDLVIQVRSAYGTPDGGLSMQPFFDLLVLHEGDRSFSIPAAGKRSRERPRPVVKIKAPSGLCRREGLPLFVSGSLDRGAARAKGDERLTDRADAWYRRPSHPQRSYRPSP